MSSPQVFLRMKILSSLVLPFILSIKSTWHVCWRGNLEPQNVLKSMLFLIFKSTWWFQIDNLSLKSRFLRYFRDGNHHAHSWNYEPSWYIFTLVQYLYAFYLYAPVFKSNCLLLFMFSYMKWLSQDIPSCRLKGIYCILRLNQQNGH